MLAVLVAGCAPDLAPADEPGAGPARALLQAPLAPRFLAHRELRAGAVAPARAVPPAPLDLSHMRGVQLEITPPMDQPASGLERKHDLRDAGRFTEIKKQNMNQSCWTFPPVAALEWLLLPGERWDFSENNLRCAHGFDLQPQDGGTALMTAAYFARAAGPVLENDDPYPKWTAGCNSPKGLRHRKVVTQMLIIPDRAGPLDNANLKAAIKAYGPIATCLHYDSEHYLKVWKSYRNPKGTTCTHLVNLVGWDDDFDGYGFATSAPGDGAWIIRNSWGDKWGDGGYGYVSYYDGMIGTTNWAYTATTGPMRGGRVYQHDPLGWVNSVGYDAPTAWMANVFVAAADEPLHSVSFYAAAPKTTYALSVYDGVSASPVGATLLGSRSGTLAVAGYHTVPLASLGISLKANRKFSVGVKLTTPGFNKPIPVEVPISGYSSKAAAQPGQSYASQDGVTWTDLSSKIAGANVCLKAFSGTRNDLRSCGAHRFDGSTWSFTSRPAGTTCRPAAGQCDQAEACDGTSWTCPADRFKPGAAVCRESTGVCDEAERCTGKSARCPEQAFYPRGIVCRTAGGECDPPELCSGDSPHCPGELLSPDGAPCAEGEGTCAAGQCQVEGGCALAAGGSSSDHGAAGAPWLALLLALLLRRRRSAGAGGGWTARVIVMALLMLTLACAAAGCSDEAAGAATDGGRDQGRACPAKGPPTGPPFIYLAFDGVTLTSAPAGFDDATKSATSLVSTTTSYGKFLASDPGRVKRIVGVQTDLARVLSPYAVGITTTRPPPAVDYMMVVFAGVDRGALLGMVHHDCGDRIKNDVIVLFEGIASAAMGPKGMANETIFSIARAIGMAKTRGPGHPCSCDPSGSCTNDALCTVTRNAQVSFGQCPGHGAVQDEDAAFASAFGCR